MSAVYWLLEMSRVVQTHVLAGVRGLEHLIWQPSSGCLAAQRKVCRRESSPVQATQSPPSASDSSVFTPWWVVAWWRWRGSGWRLSSLMWPSSQLCGSTASRVFRQLTRLSRLPVTELIALRQTSLSLSLSLATQLEIFRGELWVAALYFCKLLRSRLTEESRIFTCSVCCVTLSWSVWLSGGRQR